MILFIQKWNFVVDDNVFTCENKNLCTFTLLAVSTPINPLNAELNPIYHLLALLGAHHILHVSRIRVNNCVVWLVVPLSKGKVVPVQCMKAFGCPVLYLDTFLTLALDRGGWSASCHSCLISGKRAPGNNWIRGLVGPRACVAREKSLTLPVYEPSNI